MGGPLGRALASAFGTASEWQRKFAGAGGTGWCLTSNLVAVVAIGATAPGYHGRTDWVFRDDLRAKLRSAVDRLLTDGYSPERSPHLPNGSCIIGTTTGRGRYLVSALP